MCSCIFRILFRVNEISCMNIRRGLYHPAGKWGKRGKTGRLSKVSEVVRKNEPVEKPVESVNNFLYKWGIYRRSKAKEGRSTELFA